MPRWTMARLRTGSRNRCASRPKAAEPVPRPMRKASRMMVNEKIDEPMMTARARVQRTCKVMAVAPDTAKAKRTARRASRRNHDQVGLGRVGLAANSSRLGPLGATASGGGHAGRFTMAAASDMSKLAARKLVLRTPMSGSAMNRRGSNHFTPPKMFTAYSVPRRRLTRPNSKGREHEVASQQGQGAHQSGRQRMSSAAEATKRSSESRV